MLYKRSSQLFSEAEKVIPGGVNSPVRAFKSVGGTPIYIKEAKEKEDWATYNYWTGALDTYYNFERIADGIVDQEEIDEFLEGTTNDW